MKDHSKHLRSLQFSILSICFLLAVTIFSNKGRIIQAAINDLETITSVTRSSEDLYYDFKKYVDSIYVSRISKRPGFIFTTNSKIKESRYEFDIHNLESNWQIIYHNKDNLIIKNKSFNNLNSLSEFKNFWDELGNISIHYPMMVEDSLNWKLSSSWGGYRKAELTINKSNEDINFIQIDLNSDNLIYVEDKNENKNPKTTLITFEHRDRSQSIRFQFDFRSEVKGELNCRPFINPFESKLSFSDNFPELNALTKHIDGLPFNKIEDHLNEQKSKYGDSIKIFSAEIPFESLSIWGIILVLITQFYFWLNLKELNRKEFTFKINDLTSWTGLHKNVYSQIFSAFSVTLIPFSLILYMVYRYVILEWWLFGILAIVIGIILLILILREFYKLYDDKIQNIYCN